MIGYRRVAEQDGVAVMLYTCVREVYPVRNLAGLQTILGEISRGFRQPLQANAGILKSNRPLLLLPNSYVFTSHDNLPHSTLLIQGLTFAVETTSLNNLIIKQYNYSPMGGGRR